MNRKQSGKLHAAPLGVAFLLAFASAAVAASTAVSTAQAQSLSEVPGANFAESPNGAWPSGVVRDRQPIRDHA